MPKISDAPLTARQYVMRVLKWREQLPSKERALLERVHPDERAKAEELLKQIERA